MILLTYEKEQSIIDPFYIAVPYIVYLHLPRFSVGLCLVVCFRITMVVVTMTINTKMAELALITAIQSVDSFGELLSVESERNINHYHITFS